jgi:hypothetical protein
MWSEGNQVAIFFAWSAEFNRAVRPSFAAFFGWPSESYPTGYVFAGNIIGAIEANTD